MRKGGIIIVIIKYIRRTAFPPSNQGRKNRENIIKVS
jgi:hypothetical protein